MLIVCVITIIPHLSTRQSRTIHTIIHINIHKLYLNERPDMIYLPSQYVICFYFLFYFVT